MSSRPDSVPYSGYYRGLIPGDIKQPGLEADRSPTTSAEVKKMWIYTSTPQYVFKA
jgi:hypothetical protein